MTGDVSFRRMLGRSAWTTPCGPRHCRANLFDDWMRRPEAKPPNLRHENNPRPKLGLVVKLNRNRMDIEPPILFHLSDAHERHSDLPRIVGDVHHAIIHPDTLESDT